MFAIVKISGHQYKVSLNDMLVIDRVEGEVGDQVDFSDVLLCLDGDNVLVGKPYLENVTVQAKIIAHEKGEKLRVARFKAKSRYRKVRGFRPLITKIKIEKIIVKGKKKKKAS